MWAVIAGGASPAREFIQSNDVREEERERVLALLKHLANVGERLAFQADKFKKLGDQAKGDARKLWELRPAKQIRILGDFRPNRVFVVAIGVRKKQDALRPEDIGRAMRVLAEHDQVAG